MKRSRSRSRNLGAKELDLIVGLLDGWSGALSWNQLIDAIELRLFFRYTRQALNNHDRIGEAFRLCKARLTECTSASREARAKTPMEQALRARLTRRDAEVVRLEAQNQRLIERYVVWLYNAQARGLGLSELDRPLPPVHRGQTRFGLRASGDR